MIDRILDRAFVMANAAETRVREQLGPELQRWAKAAQGPVDRKAFIPTDPKLSLLQSVMEDRLRSEDIAPLVASSAFDDPAGPMATLRAAELGQTADLGDMTPLDPGWFSEVPRALVDALVRGPHPLSGTVPPSRPPKAPLATDAAMVLLSDWGTGGPAAIEVAARVREELARDPDRETHVLHLGDVYYAGTEWEARERFLKHWPVAPDPPAQHRSWCLNGNHDMYSGGWGLFGEILQDDRFAGHSDGDGQAASCFVLQNEHWYVIALDTTRGDLVETMGGHAGWMDDAQQEWLTDCAEEAGDRRVMLLSHHQPFDFAGEADGNLFESVAPAFANREIDAWFWGHQHRCMRFAPQKGYVRYAACVGNGAMPEPVGTVPAPEGAWEFNDWHTDHDGDRWRLCGYAALRFDGPQLEARYVDERGRAHHTEAV